MRKPRSRGGVDALVSPPLSGDSKMLPFKISRRRTVVDGMKIGPRICTVEDPATGRKWEWKEEDQPGLEEFLDDLMSNYHPLARRGKKEKENLATGPQVASEKRKTKAAEKHAVIDREICNLLKHPDSARWTNDEIAQFLIDRKLSTLKFEPTKNIVKRIAARERAKVHKP